MYGMNKRLAEIAYMMLQDQSLDEILEDNDLLPEDVLELLIEQGLIDVSRFEGPQE